jgi:hypothetical protein
MNEIKLQNTLLTTIFKNRDDGIIKDLWVSLHTADPGELGNQSTNEVNYTSYKRVLIASSGEGWCIKDGYAYPTDPIVFQRGTGGSGTATHFGIGTSWAGAGELLYVGTITPNIPCGYSFTPQLTSSMIKTTIVKEKKMFAPGWGTFILMLEIGEELKDDEGFWYTLRLIKGNHMGPSMLLNTFYGFETAEEAERDAAIWIGSFALSIQQKVGEETF